ncbi:MAG: hypothetical protein KA028_02560 [Candidatus Pacebacteria bacterium]|nr:hypothetical protein [Candidatus Paceibacterota bacterium]MBP9852269.1 hypothetical protein [Candidatus Paceibacterota bacterium]
MDSSQKLIEDRLAQLPPYIKTALANINWAPEILSIGKKHGLHVDEMGTLQTETVLVLVGLVHPNEYASNLAHELHVPKDKIDGIVADVNERILKTIRQSLIEFIENENNQEAIFHNTGIDLEAEEVPDMHNEMPIGTTVAPMEKDILEHSGVEVNEDRPETEVTGDIDRNDILSTIEHPPKNENHQFSHLIRTKLSDAVITPEVKTKYQDAAPVPPKAPERKGNDPYREPIQ